MTSPISQSFNAATFTPGPQAAISVDYLPLTTTTLAGYLVSGTIEYSVEATMDPADVDGVTQRWFTLHDFPVGTADTKYAVVFDVWRFIRVNIVVLTGEFEFKLAQAFNT